MRCPVCESTDLAISSREGVEIDYCPQCRGVWLDRGELDKIIDRAGPAAGGDSGGDRPSGDRGSSDRDRDRDRDRDDRYDKRKKRRSFLEEIFDFD